MTRSQYQALVRIGNWFEDTCLEQEKVETFKKQRDGGQLLIEKTRRLFDNFHKEIELEAPKETIRFGAIVQLMPALMNICDQNPLEMHPVLSVTINEHVVRHSQHINNECELTVAPSLKPCVRNSFRIVSPDDVDREANNEQLKYGQPFRLQCVETENESLYLYTCLKSADLTSRIHSTYESRKYGEINLSLGVCLLFFFNVNITCLFSALDNRNRRNKYISLLYVELQVLILGKYLLEKQKFHIVSFAFIALNTED